MFLLGAFGNVRLTSLALDILLGHLSWGTCALASSFRVWLGIHRLGISVVTFAGDLPLGVFRLVTFAWNIPLENFGVEALGFFGFSWHLLVNYWFKLMK